MPNNSRNILIIGSNSKISEQIVPKLSIQQNIIFLTYRSKKLINHISRSHKKLDLGSKKSIDNYIDFLMRNNIKLDSVIFLAGELSHSKFENLGYKDILRYISNQLVGSIYFFSKILPLLNVKSNIIFLNSRSAIKGSYDVMYSVVKGGLLSLAKSISNRLLDNQKLLVILSSTIKDSRMYESFSLEIQERHRIRSKGNLLTIKQVADLIVKMEIKMQDKKFSKFKILKIGDFN